MGQHASSSAEATVLLVNDPPTLFAESLGTALVLDGHRVHLTSPEDFVAPTPDDGRRIAVVDLDLGPLDQVLLVLRALVQREVRVVVVTASDDPDRWAEYLENGASLVTSKNVPLRELVSVIGRVVAGQTVITDGERDALLRSWHEHTRVQQERSARFARLTAAERWVLGHLVHGRLPGEIARLGGVPPHRVNSQILSILGKLRVSSTHAAVALAHDHGWTPPPV